MTGLSGEWNGPLRVVAGRVGNERRIEFNCLKTNPSVVIPAGFEPTTDSLEGCCSIQLSYETMSIFGCKSTKFRSIYKFISCFLVLSASDGRRFIPDRASAEAPLSLVKTSRTVCPACFESSAGRLFSGPAAGDGVGVRRICDGCSRTFSVICSGICPDTFSVRAA